MSNVRQYSKSYGNNTIRLTETGSGTITVNVLTDTASGLKNVMLCRKKAESKPENFTLFAQQILNLHSNKMIATAREKISHGETPTVTQNKDFIRSHIAHLTS